MSGHGLNTKNICIDLLTLALNPKALALYLVALTSVTKQTALLDTAHSLPSPLRLMQRECSGGSALRRAVVGRWTHTQTQSTIIPSPLAETRGWLPRLQGHQFLSAVGMPPRYPTIAMATGVGRGEFG